MAEATERIRRRPTGWPLAAVAAVLALSTGASAMEPVFEVTRSDSFVGPSLLVNGGFEGTDGGAAVGWRSYEQGYSLAEGRAGGAAIRCANPDRSAHRGAAQTVVLNQERPAPILVRGWSRCEGVSGSPGNDYSLYVDLYYTDGTPLWGQTARFRTGTHGWEQSELVIRPAKPVRQLTVYTLFRSMSGQVWFDDVELKVLDRDLALLDGLPVSPRTRAPASGTWGQVGTGDGLTLQYDAGTGRVGGLRLGDAQVAGTGGFMVRDVAAGSDLFGFQAGVCPDLGLRLDAQVQDDARCVRVSGRLVDTTGQDRAVTLLFGLPIGGAFDTWHDDVRQARRLDEAAECSHVARIGTGANGEMSVYPLGCITGQGAGLAIALDMGMPGQYRIGVSRAAGMLYIACDFGLCSDTDAFPGAAPFSFVIYQTDPEWGFRAALEELYAIFPDYFICRSREQGIWMPFTDVSTVEGWQDFGFRYHEGTNNVPWDDAHGILSFRYTEPSTWWMPIDPELPRTRENVLAELEHVRTSGRPWRRRHAEATVVSGSYDEEGRLQYLVRDTPWTNGAVFSLNPNPRIPGESEGRMYWNPEVKERLYGPDAEGEQDGEYLDSLEAYVTAGENFRREHFRYVTVPLTFSTADRRPVIHKAFSQYEFTRWLAEDIHGMGKLMFANSVPSRFSFLCPWLDVMGREMDWLTPDGEWRPPGDRQMNLYRAMSWQKPYCILMNTRFPRFTPDLVEKYMQRCLFYGIWPSMFSHNASEDPYWRNPDYYNRDRHLFRRYIPLVRRVAGAGWQPVTHARSPDEDVWIERFGPGDDGAVYLTVFNSSGDERSAVIRCDVEQLGCREGQEIVDIVDGSAMPAHWDDGTLSVRVTVGPEQVRVLQMRGPRGD